MFLYSFKRVPVKRRSTGKNLIGGNPKQQSKCRFLRGLFCVIIFVFVLLLINVVNIMFIKSNVFELEDVVNGIGSTLMFDSVTRATTPPTEVDGLLFLNESDTSGLLRLERSKQRNLSQYNIDVLVIGSKEQVDMAKVQRETWASHDAVRHFFLSTEYDDVDPLCKDDTERFDLLPQVRTCHSHAHWKNLDSLNKVTENFRRVYARREWLQKKKNPKGWLCVQRRFITSFTKLVELYAETKSLPDYFILADDDTYINIDHILQMFFISPKLQLDEGLNQEMMMYPTIDEPVVTAGCRVRTPDHFLTNTFGYGGYGTFFSRGSLERLIEPMNCNMDGDDIIVSGANNDPSKQSCKKLLNKLKYSYPMNATISEEKFFKMGDSLNQVFYKYSRNLDVPFCMHSDWFVGYLANFHNISRHTSTLGGDWFDERKADVQENRLHQMKGNIIYRAPEGECKHGESEECNAESTVCHRMNSKSLRNIYRESLS